MLIVAVLSHGADAITVTYQDADGGLGQRLLYRADEPSLSIETPASRWQFDADPVEFRLVAEALRIRMAGLHDPMVAVSSSAVDPLPHQIRAVYGELLPRIPLRFLLADDPGAGKTIMAGLYAKELLLRGDLSRMLIIAPGSLVEQWQDELAAKFGITAELLSREMITSLVDSNPFTRYPILIARMDQLARNDDLLTLLDASDWDLIVVDEAHRMSANYYSGELDTTRRYQLGQRLGAITRHLLLMTATPHAGSESSFQAFMALLDPDRFEGEYRSGAHTTDTAGLMRRMVKEELLTFEGKPLFPERIAETVPYQLSPGEKHLYDEVTHYVREEMNRAERLGTDNPRARTVGFALTVLQRRLASSTHAILRSLQRRRERLEAKRQEMLNPRFSQMEDEMSLLPWTRLEDPDELDAEETENLEEAVVDAATAAQTVAELDIEIAQLSALVNLAKSVSDSGEDRKWTELRSLLLDEPLLHSDNGPRKLIIFTEHRDTLNYLTHQIRNVLGRADAVVTIHGGTRRDERRVVREAFTHDPDVRVLVATDAAGEGLNLQAAHLMINYDLPWNPNRIEQRFGRIHRIGQKQTCRLWNLVADDTREGQVFTRLLEKMEAQRTAYGGRLFDVLGDAFNDQPLSKLLMEAIRYGDDPARRAELERVVDAEIAKGTEDLLRERALARESLTPHQLNLLRRQMDEARARRLQPYYIELFFRDAFKRFGGRISRREQGRYEIPNVPATIRTRQRPGAVIPIATRYERTTFEPDCVDADDARRAELLAPGHPLMDTVLDATIESHRNALESGTLLFDPTDPGTEPRLIVALTAEIVDGTGTVVSKRFEFVTLAGTGGAMLAGAAPYLDLQPLPAQARPAAQSALTGDWLKTGVEQLATSWAVTNAQPQHLEEVREQLLPLIEKTRAAVRQRLVQQINFLDAEAARLRDAQSSGKTGRSRKNRQSPDRLEVRARDLEARLERRTAQLDAEAQLAARPPSVVGAALVIPAGLVAGPIATYAKETAGIERRAVDAALAAERALGREPIEMPHNNTGYDIHSTTPEGESVFIEVKGRIAGAEDVTITLNEVLLGKNVPAAHRLVLVEVSPDGTEHDRLRYIAEHFRSINLGDLAATDVRLNWAKTWAKGTPPC
ncbi:MULTISPECIES: helicase-related protein [Mycolicibacterium]|uniref:helicase-related protein n=1 Tax=Mycolicibacterium TaxID=1866885 RepID=UPI001F3EBC99|nr:helicase-related protein [Mycolicibacterium austroafricanum]